MSRLAATLCLALVACPKAPPPGAATPATAATAASAAESAPPGPPPTAPPANPLTAPPATTPEVDAPGAPPIAGDPQGRDIERLARSRLVYTLSTDAPVLGDLAAVPPEALLDALSFDPRWRVGWSGGVTLACRRPSRMEAEGSGAYIADVPSSGGAPERLWRVCLRFGARPADHPWSASPLVSHNSHEQRDLKVAAAPLDSPPYAGWQSAALTVDAPGLSVEIHEVAPRLDMARTSAALGDLQARLASIAGAATRERPQRAALATLPAGEPQLGAPSLRCLRGADGALKLDGRVNPSAPAWVWARPLGADGAPLAGAEAAIAATTLERAGGSAEAGTTWSWAATLPAGAAAGIAAFELWSAADAGAAPQPLHQGLRASCG